MAEVSARGDFPGNCSTNVYVLSDFGEVAYIVCTVSIPPSSNHVVQTPSPESNFIRLKHTEAQFRQASILAIIDPDTSQLYTFYKKIDVVKDQANLLHKFGHIIRSNSCTIAYKTATRVPELFKPENAKLYRLFVSAIMASIRILPDDRRRIVRLGQRYHAFETSMSTSFDHSNDRDWMLLRIDLQILQTGHVVLAVVRSKAYSLKALPARTSESKMVVLAPTGQVAVCRHSSAAESSSASNDTLSISPDRRSAWQDKVTTWLKAEGKFEKVDTAAPWLELSIPIHEQADNIKSEDDETKLKPVTEGRLAWRPLLWPASLCFALSADQHRSLAESIGDHDPFDFVQKWTETSKERELEHERALRQAADADANDAFIDDDLIGSIDTYTAFEVPNFPNSQTVYPTPPDVAMQHGTPGLASLDAMAMTPSTTAHGVCDTPRAGFDREATNTDTIQGSVVGSGLYEDDLFEEMPDGAFDSTDNAPEPNWDFFDKADIEMRSHPATPSFDDHSIEHTESAARAPDQVASDQSSRRAAINHETALVQGNGGEHSMESQGLTNNDFDLSTRTMGESQESSTLPSAVPKFVVPAVPKRRRSSAYDTIVSRHEEVQHDAKYVKKGEYWFDTTSTHTPVAAPQQVEAQSESSASDSSSVTSESEDDRRGESAGADVKAEVQQWHLYERPKSTDSDARTFDLAALESEIQDILDMLKPKSSQPALEELLIPRRHILGKAVTPVMMRLMIAQVFVDQYTQASLLHSRGLSEDAEAEGNDGPGVIVDFSQMNCEASYASASFLTDIGPALAGRKTPARITRLPDERVQVMRSDKLMYAAPAILPFWETLNLQPVSRLKDVVAFCFHPAGSGYADGCRHFMNRVSDAYQSCGLGQHTSGQIPNFTADGTIAFGATEGMVVAKKFAEAVARESEATTSMVIYMVAKSNDPSAYMGCCRVFAALFMVLGNFGKSKSKQPELILQVLPATFVASTETIFVPPQEAYNRLAFEVYGRLPPAKDSAPATCEYPLTLADTSDIVRFDLNSQASPPSSNASNSLHLAYSCTEDKRWLVAAWTDGLGHKALSMTYQLKSRSETGGRTRDDIIKELWEASHDIMRKYRSKWRLIVARTGFFEATELNCWTYCANSETKSYCELCLLCVEPEPAFELFPTVSQSKGQPIPVSQPTMYGTPVSTPQATNITSPENLMIPATPTPGGTGVFNAPTPPEHGFDASVETDLTLIDPASESWAVILGFGMNQSYDILDIRPALLSGYLVKRRGDQDENGTISLGLHMVEAPGAGLPNVQTLREELLGEVIEQYRGLATLAVARGCVNKARSILPWHVHTTLTASRVLGAVM